MVWVIVTAVTLGLSALITDPVAATAARGFGAGTPGGEGRDVVRVTTLADAGPGSLREAVRQGYRTIAFDVAGEIALTDPIAVGGPYVTIDGFTAPPPGITLRDAGLVIRGSRGAHDVVVRGLRVRGAVIDGIQVSGGAYNVLIEHVSVDGSGDGNIDITEESRDVTVAWSVLTGTTKNMLIKYGASRVTLQHNISIGNGSRNPQARIDDDGGRASETTLDMRHNLVWDWSGYGTLIWEGAWANVAHNYYGSSRRAIEVTDARGWVHGNVAADGADIDRAGTETVAFDAPALDGADACGSAVAALAGAGVRPLDEVDRAWLGTIGFLPCAGAGGVVIQLPVEEPVTLEPPRTVPASGAGALAGSTLEVAVATGDDDGREDDAGGVRLDTPVLSPGARSLVALRFTGVAIPPGARIASATLWTFAAQEADRPVGLRYTGEARADAPAFTREPRSLSSRPRTRAFVDDVPGDWVSHEYNPGPDLGPIVQEIVDQPGWRAGQSLVLFVADQGSSRGRRRVAAFEHRGDGGTGAVLLIRYR
jgi:pectate lyase